MSATWYAGATHRPIAGLNSGGSMTGGPPRVIHHTTEGSTASGAEATYSKTGNGPHFTIDYAHDGIDQHLPVNEAATAVQHTETLQTNRMGSYCIQIEWVGFASQPFTTGHVAGPRVKAFFDWLRSLGIPNAWPMGAPLSYPKSYGLNNGDRNASIWASHAGHYGHSQVPENEHGDPGAINPNFINQSAHSHPAPAPAPVHNPYVEPTVTIQQGCGTDAQTGRTWVHWVQWASHADLDGIWGNATTAAVKAYQHLHGLVEDGIVGPNTRAVMTKETR